MPTPCHVPEPGIYAKRVIIGAGGCFSRSKPFYGGMYVEDYKRDTTQFKRAVEMNLRESDGLMVFDIVHIIDRDWWGPLQRAVEAYETGEAGR